VQLLVETAIMRISQRVATLMIAVGVLSSVPAGAATGAPSHACHISPTTYEGWSAQQISNDWVRLTIVPQLGGRLMQVSFGGHDFLFVNPKYKGKYISPSQAAGRWINYGGDKVWPLPEGNEDEHHWVLKSDPLDDGEYTFHMTATGDRCAALLEGPPDPVTGLQYSREISISSGSPIISFHAVMKNIADHPIAWSVQSVSQYDLAEHTASGGFRRNFYAYTPVNRHSSYFAGYQVRNGLADDPSFEVKDGMFRLHWLYLENEVWLDSPDGWLAVVDGDAKYAMVERFTFEPKANYPGNATVIFYKNGASLGVDEKLIPKLTLASAEETPYYMEAELNSPMVSLRPGESYAFDTRWFPTRASDGFSAVTAAGVTSVPATARKGSSGVLIAGTFGVFYPGEVVALFLDDHGREMGSTGISAANPLQLLELHKEVQPPAGTTKVVLHIVDEAGVDRGVLGESEVKPGTGDAA
jgi:hypothetical protein